MHSVLVLGAGRSSGALIDYLALQKSIPLTVTVADRSFELAQSKTFSKSNCTPVELDLMNHDHRRKLIKEHNLIISLMPPHLHHIVAVDAIEFGKHTITASYISKELKELDDQAMSRGVLVMGEAGLDPGLDHMSALKEIDTLRSNSEITGFKSATGGIQHPDTNSNPWKYKITWNPRNIVLAGKDGAAYVEKGKLVHWDHREVFKHTEVWEFDEIGRFEVYANRDALKYRELYHLTHIQDLYRGTIRYPGFCNAWATIVSLGLTNDHDDISQYKTLKEWTVRGDTSIRSLPGLLTKNSINSSNGSLENLEFLDLFSNQPLPKEARSSADVLQHILQDQWKMEADDQDLVLMQHQFFYRRDGIDYCKTSSMHFPGRDRDNTAMSTLVGLPMGIIAVKILEGIQVPNGVHIPNYPGIYLPVLKELEEQGVKFTHRVRQLV